MPTIHRTLRIERPVEAVFQALTAFDKIPEWIPSIDQAYISSSGPISVGTTFVEEFTLFRRAGRIIGAITEYEPNRKLTYIYAAGPVPGVWQYTFTPVSNGTHLDFRLEVPPGGFFSTRNPLLFLLIRRAILKNLQSFKAWVEEQPKS